MPDTEKDRDQEKGDEVLKRMLKTPPKPHDTDKRQKSPKEQDKSDD